QRAATRRSVPYGPASCPAARVLYNSRQYPPTAAPCPYTTLFRSRRGKLCSCRVRALCVCRRGGASAQRYTNRECAAQKLRPVGTDRKSTRLNSSHVKISYAVFCLKKKKKVPAITREVIHKSAL